MVVLVIVLIKRERERERKENVSRFVVHYLFIITTSTTSITYILLHFFILTEDLQ